MNKDWAFLNSTLPRLKNDLRILELAVENKDVERSGLVDSMIGRLEIEIGKVERYDKIIANRKLQLSFVPRKAA